MLIDNNYSRRLHGDYILDSEVNRYLVLISLSFLFSIGILRAQSYIDLFHAHYKYSPNASYDSLLNKVDVENVYTSVRLPIPRANGDVWLPGFSANRQTLIPKRNINGIYDRSQLYFLRPEIGYQKKWNDSLNTVFIFLPKAAVEYFDSEASYLQFGGIVLFNDIRNRNFTLKYGLYFNTEFFGPFFVPLIGWDWKIAEKWRMFGVLPISTRLEYKSGERYRTGVKFFSTNRSYRLGIPNINVPSREPRYNYVQYLTNQLTWFHELYLTKSIVFRGEVGFTAFRYVRMYDQDDQFDITISAFGIGKKREPLYEGIYNKFGDSFIFEAGIVYRYDLESRR